MYEQTIVEFIDCRLSFILQALDLKYDVNFLLKVFIVFIVFLFSKLRCIYTCTYYYYLFIQVYYASLYMSVSKSMITVGRKYISRNLQELIDQHLIKSHNESFPSTAVINLQPFMYIYR